MRRHSGSPFVTSALQVAGFALDGKFVVSASPLRCEPADGRVACDGPGSARAVFDSDEEAQLAAVALKAGGRRLSVRSALKNCEVEGALVRPR